MTSNYHFSLRIDNTEFSVGGDKEFVESYMAKWLPIFKDKLPAELLGEKQEEVSSQPQVRGKMSISDFIKMKSPKNYNDLVLTVFFYNERYEGLENVGVSFSHISDFFSKMSNKPSNEEIQNIITQLIDSDGFLQMMPGTEANPRYQVTFTGEQCVKQGFKEEA